MLWLKGLASVASCMSWKNTLPSGRRNENANNENSTRVH